MRSFYLHEASRAQLEGPETAAVLGMQSCTWYRTLAELSQLGASDPVKCFGISRG